MAIRQEIWEVGYKPSSIDYYNPDAQTSPFFWLDKDTLPYPVILPALEYEYGSMNRTARPLGLYGKKWRIAVGRHLEEGKNIYYGFSEDSDSHNPETATSTIIADNRDWTRSLRITGISGGHHIVTAIYKPVRFQSDPRIYGLSRLDLSLSCNKGVMDILNHMTRKDNPYAGYAGGPVHTYCEGDGLVFEEPALIPIGKGTLYGHEHELTGLITQGMIEHMSDIPEQRPSHMAVVYDRQALFGKGRLPTKQELIGFGYQLDCQRDTFAITHPEADLDIHLPFKLE